MSCKIVPLGCQKPCILNAGEKERPNGTKEAHPSRTRTDLSAETGRTNHSGNCTDIGNIPGLCPEMVAARSRSGDDGFAGTPTRSSRPKVCSRSFRPKCNEPSLKLKREHKRWGANRVLIELHDDPLLTGLAFPSRSRLYAFFHQECPDCLSIWTKHKENPLRVQPPRVCMKCGKSITRRVIAYSTGV